MKTRLNGGGGEGLLRRSALAVFVAVLVTLGGCAAQSAFRDGKSLLAQGKPLEGLAKLEQASQLDPASAEYRIAYLQARERVAQVAFERGEAARSASHYEEAEGAYREMLSIRTQQDRALNGLRLVDQHRRWDALIKEAEAAMGRKDWDPARNKARAVLMESPRHAQANKLLEQIERSTSKPSAAPALAASYRQPISLEFKEVPLRTVFEVISRTSRLNFLFDKEVKTDQRTSIYLRNSTVEAAVNWLLLTNQLEQRLLDGNSVLVYPATAAKQREYQPLTVKSFYLANADAKGVANTIKTLLKSKDVVVDDKINLIIMRDSMEAIRLAEKLVALHDVPEPEVMLEVEILEVKRGRLLDLGVRWPEQVGLSLLPSTSGGTLTLEDLRNPTRSSVAVATGSMTLRAQKQDADTNILANPRIRARNHEKAKILIGERVPNITTTSTSTGFVAESVNYVDVGLKLEVEPTIHVDNEVAIKIALEVSSIISQQQTKAGSVAYQLGTRSAQTVLRLRDGENQVLAGLINDEERRTAYKVPALGEMPIVGRLFGSQADDSSKTEIVLSITPRILRNVQPPNAEAMEFESGTEGSLRAWLSETAASPQPGAPASAASSTAPRSPAVGGNEPSARGPMPLNVATAGAPAPAPATVVTTTAGAVPGQTQLRWEGPSQVRPSEAFTLLLAMHSEQAVSGFSAMLGYDPKVLQVVSVAEGGFLKEGGAPTTFSHRIDPSGQVSFSLRRVGGASGATSPGVVAAFSVRALSSASVADTQFRLLSITSTGTSGQSVSVPIPAAHALKVVP